MDVVLDCVVLAKYKEGRGRVRGGEAAAMLDSVKKCYGFDETNSY